MSNICQSYQAHESMPFYRAAQEAIRIQRNNNSPLIFKYGSYEALIDGTVTARELRTGYLRYINLKEAGK